MSVVKNDLVSRLWSLSNIKCARMCLKVTIIGLPKQRFKFCCLWLIQEGNKSGGSRLNNCELKASKQRGVSSLSFQQFFVIL